jgi:hypothetical protein
MSFVFSSYATFTNNRLYPAIEQPSLSANPMKQNALAIAFMVGLALAYAVIAYTSGSEATRSGDLMAGALLYGPLIVGAASMLFRIKRVVVDGATLALAFSLALGTALMASIGYNMAGAIVGLINLVLCWVVGIRALGLSARKDA